MSVTEPILLVVKPGAITLADRELCARAGIVVIETDEPDAVRLLRPNSEISGSAMLCAAMKALKESDGIQNARVNFAMNVADAVLAADKP